MLASDVTTQVAEVLQDQSNVTWTEAQLLAWLNDAQRAVVSVRPDAYATTGVVTLAAGTKQSLPAGALRLMAVVRNMGVGGTTPGKAVRLTDRATLDTFSPDWHSEDPEETVQEYCLDDRDPTVFWVNPPAVVNSTVEATYALSPAVISDPADSLSLADTYAPALIEWMLYRCFSRDSEQTPNYARAAGHVQNFFSLLGAKMQGDLVSSPKVKAHLG